MTDRQITLPEDVQVAVSVAPADIDVDAALMTAAERDGVDGRSLSHCTITEVRMVLTNGRPWWQLLCTGNPVLAERKLYEAGYPDACAGAPGRIWLRVATDDERTRYESETDKED